MPRWLGSLSPKALAVLFAVVAINTALSFYVLESVVRPAFERIERRQSLDDVARIRSALRNEFAHLTSTAADWAVWDESFAFVQGRNEQYVSENILPSVFQNLNLTGIGFFDTDGRKIFARTGDPRTGGALPLPGLDIERLFADLAAQQQGATAGVRTGLFDLDGELLIVVSHPVQDNFATQPPAGTMLMVRPANAALLAELRRNTGINFWLLPLSDLDPTALAPAGRQLFADPAIGTTVTDFVSADRLAAYSILPGITGQPVALLEARLGRDVATAGREAVDLAILLMIAGALAVLAVVWLLLDRMFLRPVQRLTRHIKSAPRDDSAKLPAPLGWRRNDELGILADAYDTLNAALARQVKDLNLALEGLHAADAAKSTFFASMSHELRTPLNAIIGFSELLGSEAFGPLPSERYRTYVGDIHNSGHHLLDLVNQILEFAKTDSQQLHFTKAPVDIRSTVDEAMRMIQLQAERSGVEMRCEVATDLPLLLSDRLRLSQILLNLLSNAVKFTDPGGHVTVDAVQDRGRIILQIRDTGIGMAPEEIPRAMAPFVQLQNRRRRNASDDRGTGLGLPLARRLTELLDGRFDLESVPGQGTTVTLTFPCPAVSGGADAVQPERRHAQA